MINVKLNKDGNKIAFRSKVLDVDCILDKEKGEISTEIASVSSKEIPEDVYKKLIHKFVDRIVGISYVGFKDIDIFEMEMSKDTGFNFISKHMTCVGNPDGNEIEVRITHEKLDTKEVKQSIKLLANMFNEPSEDEKERMVSALLKKYGSFFEA